MLNKRWLPSPLLNEKEQPVIPIVDGRIKNSFRSWRVSGHFLKLCFKLIYLKLMGRLNTSIMGKMIGDFCQSRGVLWIKLGQLLSMRSDLFPAELCAELARLQDRVEGFPASQVKEILEKELNRPLEDIFSSFDMHPCAAASIAQVHRAFLKKEKAWVAIKVRRPGIDHVFTQDMALIEKLFFLLHRFSMMPGMRWPDMLWELKQVFIEELDYRYEISNQQRLRHRLAKHMIYVPKIFEQYCTKEILVMEFLEAVSMVDFLRLRKTDPKRVQQWMDQNNINAETVGKHLFQSYIRQVLEDNLFHADLHPGNILLLKDSRFALLDFGSIGCNEGDLLRKYDVFLQSLSSGRFSKAIDVFLMIMPDVPSSNLMQVKEEIQRRFHDWDSRCRLKELPYNEKSTNMVFDDMLKVMARYGITINWAFFKVVRGWATMDTSLRDLIPEVDLPRLMQFYLQKRRNREFRKVALQLPGDLLKLQNIIDYPREFSEMAIYRGAAVRRLAQVFEGTATRVSRLAAGIFEMGSAFFFICTSIFCFFLIYQHSSIINVSETHPIYDVLNVFPTLDPQIWALIILFVLKGFLAMSKLARRFRKQE